MKPTYDALVAALRQVKSNGTRLRYDTRHLVMNLLTDIDIGDEPLGSVDHMPDERGMSEGEDMENQLMTSDTARVEAALEWMDYYRRELNRLEIPPNGDDWNELYDGLLSILQNGIEPSLILKAEGR